MKALARAMSLVVAALLLPAMPAHAMDFVYIREKPDDRWPISLKLQGQIVKGDHQKLLRKIRQDPISAFLGFGKVWVESPGGDVGEAMQIAQTLQAFYPIMLAGGPCASSCSLVWLAGAWRLTPRGKIGVHRPKFDETYYGNLPVAEARRKYAEMETSFRQFVEQQGMPKSIYERLIATPSYDIYWLNREDLNLIGVWPPYFDERLNAGCVMKTDTDEAITRLQQCSTRLVVTERFGAIDDALAGSVNADYSSFKEDILEVRRKNDELRAKSKR